MNMKNARGATEARGDRRITESNRSRRAVIVPLPGSVFHHRLLALDAEVGPTVLGPALLGGVGARRALLAVGDRRHPVLRDAVGLQIIQRRLGAPIAQRSEERRVGKECRSRWSPCR